MTTMTKYALLTAALSILTTAGMMPAALAQDAPATKEKAAAPVKQKRPATKKGAKLTKEATKDITKGVEQANKNLSK